MEEFKFILKHALEMENKAKKAAQERSKILESLFSIRDMVHGTPWVVVNKLIDQLNQQGEINVPSFLDVPQSVKEEAINHACEAAANVLLMAFITCGLKTHIQTNVVNDPTNEKFLLSFIKIQP